MLNVNKIVLVGFFGLTVGGERVHLPPPKKNEKVMVAKALLSLFSFCSSHRHNRVFWPL